MDNIDCLGDGVYAAMENGMIKLMSGSHDNPDNVIYLEKQVLDAFFRYVENQ